MRTKIYMTLIITLSIWKNIFAGEVPPQLISDYNKWLNSSSIGDVIDWAGGRLYRTSTGGKYVDPLGMISNLPNENPDYNFIANDNPNIAKQWFDQYGYRPNPKNEHMLNPSGNLSVSSTSNAIPALNVASNYEYISKLKDEAIRLLNTTVKKFKDGNISQEEFVRLASDANKTIQYSKDIGKNSLSDDLEALNSATLKLNAGKLSKSDYINTITGLNDKISASNPAVSGILLNQNIMANNEKIAFVENLKPDVDIKANFAAVENSFKYYPSLDQLGSPKLFHFNKKFILTSQSYGNSGLYSSLDGLNWTKRSIVDSNGRALYVKNIIWDGKKYCGLAQQMPGIYGQNKINDIKTFFVSSFDGVKWNSEHTNIEPVSYIQQGDGAIFIKNSQELAWNGKIFVTVQPDLNNEQVVYTSNNGIMWDKQDPLSITGKLSKAASFYINNLGNNFVITYGGSAESINTWTSTNGQNWKSHSSNAEYFGVMGVKVVGDKIFILANNYGQIMHSTDGVSWNVNSLELNKAMAMRDIAYNGQFYLVVIGEMDYGYKSTDAKNWSIIILPTNGIDPNHNKPIGTAWSTITSNDKQMVITGMDSGSVLLQSGFATNVNIKSTPVVSEAQKQTDKLCASNSSYPICETTNELKMAALRAKIFNSKTPVSMSELGPGFDGSETVFEKELIYNYKTFVVGCREAAESYGLFGGKKNSAGTWSNEQDFYDSSNNFVGRGGAFLGVRNYFDKVTGAPRITPDTSYLKVGNCEFKN